MSLTRDEFNDIMRVISARRQEALRKQSAEEEAVYEALPAVKALSSRIADLSLQEVSLRIRKNHEEAAKCRSLRLDAAKAKAKLLRDAGYAEDCLDVHYYCMQCRDTGYADGVKCGCFRQLESELLNRRSGLPALMAKENFSTLDTGIYDSSLPLEELKPGYITQYDYMTRKGGILDRVRAYVDGFETGGSHNILMFGAPGTGKTFLCNCIARALTDRQHTVTYSRAGSLFSMMSRTAFSRTPAPEDESMASRCLESELLIIDDLGTEFATEFTRARLFSMISDRLSGGKSTIISTNLSMNQICECYGERVSSRFMGEYILLPFYGSDLRMAAG